MWLTLSDERSSFMQRCTYAGRRSRVSAPAARLRIQDAIRDNEARSAWTLSTVRDKRGFHGEGPDHRIAGRRREALAVSGDALDCSN
jgi:hypothetical protein